MAALGHVGYGSIAIGQGESRPMCFPFARMRGRCKRTYEHTGKLMERRETSERDLDFRWGDIYLCRQISRKSCVGPKYVREERLRNF